METNDWFKKYVLGYVPLRLRRYIDGYAVALTTYLLSPEKDRARNTIAVGIVHAVLHDYACSFHTEDKKDSE